MVLCGVFLEDGRVERRYDKDSVYRGFLKGGCRWCKRARSRIIGGWRGVELLESRVYK